MIRNSFLAEFSKSKLSVRCFDLTSFFYSADRHRVDILNSEYRPGVLLVDELVNSNREEVVIRWLSEVASLSLNNASFDPFFTHIQKSYPLLFNKFLREIKNFDVLSSSVNGFILCEYLPASLAAGANFRRINFDPYSFINRHCNKLLSLASSGHVKPSCDIFHFSSYVLNRQENDAFALLDRFVVEMLFSNKQGGIAYIVQSEHLLKQLLTSCVDAPVFCDAHISYWNRFGDASQWISNYEPGYIEHLNENLLSIRGLHERDDLYFEAVLGLGASSFGNAEFLFGPESEYSAINESFFVLILNAFNDFKLTELISRSDALAAKSFGDFLRKIASSRITLRLEAQEGRSCSNVFDLY